MDYEKQYVSAVNKRVDLLQTTSLECTQHLISVINELSVVKHKAFALNIWVSVLAGFVVLLLIAVVVVYVNLSNHEARITSIEDQISILKQLVNSYNALSNDMNLSLGKLKHSVSELEAAKQLTDEQLHELTSMVKQLRSENKHIEQSITTVIKDRREALQIIESNRNKLQKIEQQIRRIKLNKSKTKHRGR